MRMNSIRSKLSSILCIVLIAAMALTFTGCGGNETTGTTGAPIETTVAPTTEAPVGTSAPQSDVTVLGEGASVFSFTVVDLDGTETRYEIHTDAATVGDALLDLELIEGEESEYGLYVKEVNGIVADYDVDETYWAFYIDGEYAMTGVDATAITAGTTYSFVKTGPGEVSSDVTVLGEGATSFNFTVVDPDGVETRFEIHTDAATVGDALLALELIAGEDSEYGLYVKTVNGITVDYEADGKYWAFYIDGEYGMTGVDTTEITEGATYTFKAE